MTFGDKLIQLRKNANITQAELGVKLGVTPQAISKYEHNVAEPDLGTVKKISAIFAISLDELLDNDYEIKDNGEEYVPIDTDAVAKELAPVIADNVTKSVKDNITSEVRAAVIENTVNPIGFCVECGKVVTEDNKGKTSPKTLCKSCYLKKLSVEQEKIEKEREHDLALRNNFKKKFKKVLYWGIFLSSVIIIFTVLIEIYASGDVGGKIAFAALSLWFAYAVFSVIFECVLDDNVIVDIMEWGLTRSFHWPGVIFTFDLDGFLFLIVIKLLFAAIGFLIGAILFIIALAISLVIAPFMFPFGAAKVRKKLNGEIKLEDIEVL